MIGCKACGAKYPTERLFCGKCKAKLGIRCPVCGFINLLDDMFCGICLTQLGGPIEMTIGPAPGEPAAAPNPFYEEIRRGVQEDQEADGTDEKLEQGEIDSLFQSD